MKDFRLISRNGNPDIMFNNGDVDFTNTYDTLLMIRLFSNKRATIDQIKINSERQGYINDIFHEDSKQIGSNLYLLDMSRSDNDTLLTAQEYVGKSLQLIKNKYDISDLKYTVNYENNNEIYCNIHLFYINGNVENFLLSLENIYYEL